MRRVSVLAGVFMLMAVAFGFLGGYSTGTAQEATPVVSDEVEAPFSAGGESDA